MTECAMIYVQHLLGIGHLQRAAFLANALAAEGFDVELVSGGMPVRLSLDAGVRLTQLPPVRAADSSFSAIIADDGEPYDESMRQRRCQMMLDLFDLKTPSILITETYPFGRRMLRHELLPLLQKARETRDCLVISSIRDILQPKSKPGRNQEICDIVEQFYDHVLVHGDPRIAKLSDSFEPARRIETRLAYSGYISNRAASAAEVRKTGEVVVSSGGSNTGLRILQTAIAAKPLSKLSSAHWRILVSHQFGDAEVEQLRSTASDKVTIERNRPDFPALLAAASLSISQCGYNTMVDLLNVDTPSVVVPFADGSEVEQTLRAAILERSGRLIGLQSENLSAQSLAAAIESALELNTKMEVRLDGAEHSARLIKQWRWSRACR